MSSNFFLMACVAWWAMPCWGADAVLWQAPGEITVREWTWGGGGQERAPRPPFAFVEEDVKGTNPKIKVRDSRGERWIVKFGGEDHSDVFASRLLYAMGYLAEPSYFVASGTISGVPRLKRAKPFIGKDGAFRYARFKLRDHKALVHADGQSWSWTDNPFLGTPQLSGLKILLMLTSNWDAKDARDGEGSNTGVYTKPNSPGRLYYGFDDWGATMGKWGGFFERDKWNAEGYRAQTRDFARAAGETIQWGYRGKHGGDVTSGIRVSDVRWLLTYLSRVTDKELRAGLHASGATAYEVEVFSGALRERIKQLERLAGTTQGTATAWQILPSLGGMAVR